MPTPCDPPIPLGSPASDGGAAILDYQIQWGTDANFGSQVACCSGDPANFRARGTNTAELRNDVGATIRPRAMEGLAFLARMLNPPPPDQEVDALRKRLAPMKKQWGVPQEWPR